MESYLRLEKIHFANAMNIEVFLFVNPGLLDQVAVAFLHLKGPDVVGGHHVDGQHQATRQQEGDHLDDG